MAITRDVTKTAGGTQPPLANPPATVAPRSAGWLFLLPLLALWGFPVLLFVLLVPFSRAEEALSLRPTAVTTVVVGSRLDSAKQSVDVQVSAAQPAQVKSATAGLITKVSVVAGAPITNGMPLLTAAGVPVLAYRAEAPLYRDLAEGATGVDVQALGVWLRDIGLLTKTANGSKFTATFAAAVSKLQKKLGLEQDGILHMSLVAWVPAATTVAGTVKPRVGDSIAVGDVLVEGASTPNAITFARPAAPATRPAVPPGSLRLSAGTSHIDVASLNLTADERAQVAAFLTQQVAAGTVSTPTSNGGGAAATVVATAVTNYTGSTIASAAAKEVGVVPSSAVHSSPSGAVCVFQRTAASAAQSAARTRAVVIASPQLLMGELGSISVPAALIGKTIIRNPASLPATTQKLCR